MGFPIINKICVSPYQFQLCFGQIQFIFPYLLTSRNNLQAFYQTTLSIISCCCNCFSAYIYNFISLHPIFFIIVRIQKIYSTNLTIGIKFCSPKSNNMRFCFHTVSQQNYVSILKIMLDISADCLISLIIIVSFCQQGCSENPVKKPPFLSGPFDISSSLASSESFVPPFFLG